MLDHDKHHQISGRPHKLIRRSHIDVSSHAFSGDGGETAAGAVKRYNHKTKAMSSTMGNLGMGKQLGKSPKVSPGLNLVVGEVG